MPITAQDIYSGIISGHVRLTDAPYFTFGRPCCCIGNIWIPIADKTHQESCQEYLLHTPISKVVQRIMDEIADTDAGDVADMCAFL